jgi:hypothetical protein
MKPTSCETMNSQKIATGRNGTPHRDKRCPAASRINGTLPITIGSPAAAAMQAEMKTNQYARLSVPLRMQVASTERRSESAREIGPTNSANGKRLNRSMPRFRTPYR